MGRVQLPNDFLEADSRNLPRVDVFMVAEFISKDERFSAPEIRLVKASMSSRESYGDVGIGYVCVQRVGAICTVRGEVCPEHKVRSSNYSVTAIIDKNEELVKNVVCDGCAAAAGGCKHSLAFLMWIHRRSESPSPTQVECYWKRPIMKSIGTTKKFIDVKELCEKRKIRESDNLPTEQDTQAFYDKVVKKAEELQVDSQISRHWFDLKARDLHNLSIHQLIISFKKSEKKTAEEFIRHGITKITSDKCSEVELHTRDQKNNLLWHELRYGRVTASNLHEATHCQTTYGSLVFKLLGASKKFDSVAMERGRELEKLIIVEVEKKIKKKLSPCGLILIQQFPMLGASPDARGDDFVVEIKSPSKESTVENYLVNGNLSPKCFAQIQLQMFATKTKKGLFCVADPNFEKNKKFNHVWVEFDQKYMDAVLKNVTNFWKKNIFVEIMK